MRPEIESKREEIAELCRKYHVQRFWIFGSAVRDDFDPERSDFDFLMELESNLENRGRDYLRFTQAVEDLFDRKIDFVENGAVRNRILREEIDRTRVQLYAA